MTHDEIFQSEMLKTIVESALAKKKFLTSEEIDEVGMDAMADFLRQWNWIVAIYPALDNMRMLMIRDAGDDAYLRCQSIPCDSEATARKLHSIGRGPDNRAPEPPQSIVTH